MSHSLTRRTFAAAVAAFLVALAVAYALSSTGEASETSGPFGSPAVPLDVASGVAGNTTLGDTAALPPLAKRPEPPPPPPPDPEPVEDDFVEPPVESAPPVVETPPVYVPPPAPAPAPPPPAPEPDVEFDDSG
ncbi:MAG: hypothetical protein QOH58_515 [Thermoleophilaceae bacterium]|jgi:outer membrane biosynthesis protein TonB|nr:hypothetical protein [Thermoleophilaceae bacterium]